MLFLFSVCAAGYEGTFDPANVGGGCIPCAAGNFNAAPDGTCADCPAGQISAAAGTPACTPCPADQYVATAGQTFCDSCAVPSETTNGLTGQAFCGE